MLAADHQFFLFHCWPPTINFSSLVLLLANHHPAYCREYSKKQIAAELHISPFTVEDYKKNIPCKMQLLAVVGIVVYAMNNPLPVQTFLLLMSSMRAADGGEVFTGDWLE